MASSTSSGEAELRSRFLQAAVDGNLSLFKELLDSLREGREGLADVVRRMTTSDGLTAFHHAANAGKTAVCKYLVEQVKVDPNLKGGEGLTPLHYAIPENRHQTAVYLLEHGGDPNAATNQGRTALHYAAETGSKKLLQLLISKGAKVDAVAVCGTPLHSAAANGKKESVKVLLDNQADPNVIVLHVLSPLMMSIVGQSIECLEVLLKAGANPNVESSFMTPLMMAACEGETQMIKCLLNAEADPNVTDSLGLTALEHAALKGNHQAAVALFAVTSCIPSIGDWTLHGAMKHVHSEQARQERAQKAKENFLKSKSNGDDAFQRKEYLNAIFWYTYAISSDPSNAAVLSNRSMCWAWLNEGGRALEDAKACVELRPKWAKAHYRMGVANKLLKDFKEAEKCFFVALALDPTNEDLICAYRDMRIFNGHNCVMLRHEGGCREVGWWFAPGPGN